MEIKKGDEDFFWLGSGRRVEVILCKWRVIIINLLYGGILDFFSKFTREVVDYDVDVFSALYIYIYIYIE
jgi:hypothetical protein